ncbi:MAG TPA: hypothetical protein VGM81_11080 [Burkholderiaceae bacterium]|jgi:hypothetical protein
MKLCSIANLTVSGLCALLCSGPVCAQTAMQRHLDDCISVAQKSDAAAGGVLGFLSHFSVSVSHTSSTGPAPPPPPPPPPDNQRSSGMSPLASTAAGATIGLATAYFNAMGDCLEEHPDWMPESQLKRSADYKAAMARAGYESSQGIVIKPESVDMPAEARPETRFEVHSRFLVLTPDGGEAKVQIERKLFAMVNGVEQEITIPAPAQERRTMQAGEHEDVVKLLIPKEAPLGTIYRVEFSIGGSARNAAATSVSGSIKVL